MERHQALVIGAGPAGLAVAGELGRRGVHAPVLEASDAVGASWRRRYAHLRLNTVRSMSALPGAWWSRSDGRYPSRDAMVRHLERFAQERGLDIRFATRASRVERDPGGWRVRVDDGSEFAAARLVIATGHDAQPVLPPWPGRDDFSGELLHAADYLGPDRFRGRDVLVVGAGNTGVDIAGELDRAGARVTVSVRTPPTVVPRDWLGVPLGPPMVLVERLPAAVGDRLGSIAQRLIFGDLSRYGLRPAPVGMVTRLRTTGVTVSVDDGFVRALRARRLALAPEVARLDDAEAVLADGRRLRPDAVICATGYRRALEPLVNHLGVLDARGGPIRHAAPEHPDAQGLYFAGFEPRISGQLRMMRIHARRIARAIA